MHLIGDQLGGDTDRGKLRVWQVDIPVVLSLVDDHSDRLGHGMIHALDATDVVRMREGCRNFVYAMQLVGSVRQLGENLEAVVGEETSGASSQRDVVVNQDAGGAVGREIGRRNGAHVCTPAEMVGEQENVGIPLGSDRERADVIHANRDAKAGRKGQRSMGQRGVCL